MSPMAIFWAWLFRQFRQSTSLSTYVTHTSSAMPDLSSDGKIRAFRMEGPCWRYRKGRFIHRLCLQLVGVGTINHVNTSDSVKQNTIKTFFSFQQLLTQIEHDLIYLLTAVIIFCSLFCPKRWLHLASCQTHLATFDYAPFLKRSGLQASNTSCQWCLENYRFVLHSVAFNALHLFRNSWAVSLSYFIVVSFFFFCIGLFFLPLLNLLT